MSVFKGNVLRNEPALVTALVQVVIGMLLAFGVDLSNEQVGSIMAATAVVLAIAVRMLVTPTSKEHDAAPPAQPPPPSAEPSMYPEP